MSRTELREHIFRLLFRVEFNTKEEMEDQEREYPGEYGITDPTEREEMLAKYRAVSSKTAEIDKLLNDVTEKWKTSRMSRVDLTILRLAVYEMLWDDDIPEKVAINEAVELAKKYSGGAGPSFVNGVLAKVAGRE